jgi:hypothetical protein
MGKHFRRGMAILASLTVLFVPAVASASSQPTLNQTVNAGTLSTNILQSDDATPVASPSVAFPAKNVGFACQTSAATLGDTNNKLNVTNLASNNGWTLTMAATSGFSANWDDGASHTYKFNDTAGSGCTNGQMSIDPSVSTLTADCSSACVNTNITKGSVASYDHAGSTDSVTLLSSSDGNPWKGYLTGVSLSQKIPATQHAGSYTLGMTITVTAN